MASQSFALKAPDERDPAPTFKFWVELENIVVAEFKECGGLRIEREVQKIEEGGINDHVHILPGRSKYSNITLKRGITDSSELWDWYQAGLYDGKVKRVNFSILLRNVEGEVVKRWNVLDAFPTKWEGSSLNTESNTIAIETLEIAHHGLQLGE